MVRWRHLRKKHGELTCHGCCASMQNRHPHRPSPSTSLQACVHLCDKNRAAWQATTSLPAYLVARYRNLWCCRLVAELQHQPQQGALAICCGCKASVAPPRQHPATRPLENTGPGVCSNCKRSDYDCRPRVEALMRVLGIRASAHHPNFALQKPSEMDTVPASERRRYGCYRATW